MENAIVKQNTHHYKKVLQTKAYTNKIYTNLNQDNTRDRILKGILHKEECTDQDQCKFLTLL